MNSISIPQPFLEAASFMVLGMLVLFLVVRCWLDRYEIKSTLHQARALRSFNQVKQAARKDMQRQLSKARRSRWVTTTADYCSNFIGQALLLLSVLLLFGYALFPVVTKFGVLFAMTAVAGFGVSLALLYFNDKVIKVTDPFNN